MPPQVPHTPRVRDLRSDLLTLAARSTHLTVSAQSPSEPGDLARSARGAAPGRARRQALVDLVAGRLVELWNIATDGAAPSGIALAAVGSLGRGDLGPVSDLDLVLVHDGRSLGLDELRILAERLWYPLWDAGIDLDHSVRSVVQCRQIAAQDLPAAIGLLDLRPVAGDTMLACRAAAAVRDDWRAAARRRLPDLIAAIASRAAQQGELAYRPEPDLKEARGGIRDAVICKALMATWCPDHSPDEVDTAYERLLDARDALQLTTRRHTTRLGSAELAEVAARCGQRNSEEFLAGLADAGRQISHRLDRTLRQVGSGACAQRADGPTD